jgi:hypothetical protein
MADNKITIVQGTETIEVVQSSSEVVVTTNQAATVVTVVEKGPKGDKGDTGSAADLSAVNSFTSSIQSQVNAIIQATSSYLTSSLLDSYVLSSTLSSTLTNYTQISATGSFVTNSKTGSFITNSQTSSFVLNASTASFISNSQTSSFTLNSVTASMLSSYVTNANTSSFIKNSQTSSFATTSSNTFNGTQIISGSLTITQNLTVIGSSSILYVTSSQLNVANNLITVNASIPSVRYGGLAVIDSGSSPQVSGSLLFDSQENQWLFVHQDLAVTSSILIMGPETYNSLGNETHPTTNRIMKSVNDEHIGDSNITDTGTIVSINSNTQITGSLIATSFTGSLFGSSSYSVTASYINTLNQNLVITGSTQGNVVALSIASNTASLNLNLGNFFTLQLVPGANTYVNPSNIKPGQSSLLLISTTGSGTVSFPSSVKQPSGSSYTATTTTGTDILTFASLDNTNLYVVNVKNLI